MYIFDAWKGPNDLCYCWYRAPAGENKIRDIIVNNLIFECEEQN